LAYSLVRNGKIEYAVDWDVVERMCMSYWTSDYQWRYSKTENSSESEWYNPFSWSLPSIKTFVVDWDKVRDSARISCNSDMFRFSRVGASDMGSVAREMKWKVEQTAINRKQITDELKDIQSDNVEALESAEKSYTGSINACKFIRDTSADVVAIGSAVATGGTGVALLGASSYLKGMYKYQDTGSAGAAVLYGAGSLVVGAFKVNGAKLTSAGEYTLIIAQGVLETGTSLVAGDSFVKAIKEGGLKIASAGTAQAIFGSELAEKVFSRIPIPLNVWSVTMREGNDVMMTDIADKLLEKTSKKLTEKSVKSLINTVAKPSRNDSPRTASSGLIDDAPLEQMLLLYLAIVRMDQGIGRGW
jgi:hypothetical protein